LAIQATSSWPVGSWAAMSSPVRANARSDSRSRAQQPPPVRPRRVLGGAPPAEVLAGNPLADPGHRLIGQPDQVEVVHHDLRVGQRAARRTVNPADRRIATYELTPLGWEASRSAAPKHVEAVRKLFLEPLDVGHIRAMTEALQLIINELDPAP
jgi:hypothetical protein